MIGSFDIKRSLLFTPGFSPVQKQESIENRFNGFREFAQENR
jgi:hypothetical protein